MKFLVIITDISEEFTQTFIIKADDKEAANKKAIEKFNDYWSDFGDSWDNEDDLPSVILYEVDKPTHVDIKNHWFRKQKERDDRRKKLEEDSERMHYERLQKKFGNK
jgi:hypothetical protein